MEKRSFRKLLTNADLIETNPLQFAATKRAKGKVVADRNSTLQEEKLNETMEVNFIQKRQVHT